MLSIVLLVCLATLLARTVQANPLGSTLAPVTEAITSAVCIDAWHNTRPCHSPVRLLNDRHYPAYMASRWWSDLISTAGEVATSPRFLLGGKRASCSAAFDGASLLKLDFLRFQLNMDIDLDVEEDRFDTVRLAYRSCWH